LAIRMIPATPPAVRGRPSFMVAPGGKSPYSSAQRGPMRVRCPVALVPALVALLFVPSRLEAACASSVPMTHGVETFFTCMNVNPVAAFAYQQSDPAGVNTGGVRISCEARDDDSCFGMSGVAGDGRVTIETDWGSPGVLGCPISSSGPQRVIIALASTWGRFGQGLIVSLVGAA